MAYFNNESETKKYSNIAPITSVIFLILIITVIIVIGTKNSNKKVSIINNTPKNTEIEPKITNKTEAVVSSLNILLPENNIPTTGKVILADLSEMKISLMENGEVLDQYPILAKGLEGSRYETPFGNYVINYKEKNHKVSVRDIYMPFSAHFFGNFFIHGKPLYSNGKELFDGPSGGCIRLSNDVAEKVYAFSEKNTPVFITEDNGQNDTAFIEKITEFGTSSISISDKIKAKSYVVSDLKTGVVLAGENIKEKLPLHSLTKLMSASVADETFRDDKKIIVDPKIEGESVPYSEVKPGDEMTVTEMLYPILFKQDDLAIYSMATNIGSGYYTQLMNKKAEAIGMNSTKFSDPAGISEENVSTAQDLFVLSRYVYFKHPYISKITLKKSFSLSKNENHSDYTWVNSVTAPKDARLFSQIEKDGLVSSITIMPITILGEERLVSIIILQSEPKEDQVLSIVDSIKNVYGNKELGVNSKI